MTSSSCEMVVFALEKEEGGKSDSGPLFGVSLYYPECWSEHYIQSAKNV